MKLFISVTSGYERQVECSQKVNFPSVSLKRIHHWCERLTDNYAPSLKFRRVRLIAMRNGLRNEMEKQRLSIPAISRLLVDCEKRAGFEWRTWNWFAILHDGTKTWAEDKIVHQSVKLSNSPLVASVVFTRKIIVTTKSRRGTFESRAPDTSRLNVPGQSVTTWWWRCARRTFSFNRFNPRILLIP